MDQISKFCNAHIEGIIGAILSIIIYFVSRRDGNKTANEYKKLFLDGQKENVKLQLQLERRAIEHDRDTSDLRKKVEVAVQSLYAHNELNGELSDAFIKFQIVLKSGDISEAINFLAIRKQRFTGTVYLPYMEGMLAEKAGDIFLALEHYNIITEIFDATIFKEFHEVRRKKGAIYLNVLEYFDKAEIEYQKAYESTSLDIDLFGIIECHIEMESYKDVPELFARVKSKESFEYDYLMGRYGEKIGDRSISVSHYRKMIARAPNDPRSLFKNVLLYAYNKDIEGCLKAGHEALLQMTEHSAEHRDLLGNLGQLYMVKGNMVRANDCYEYLQQHYPHSKRWYPETFVVWREMNLHGRLVEFAEKNDLIKNVRIRKTCLLHLAYSYFIIKGDSEKAVECLRSVLAEIPNDLSTFEQMILIHFSGKMYDEAQVYIDLSIQLHPNDPSGYNGMGLMCMKDRDLIGAKRHYQHALQLNPNDNVAQINLSLLSRLERLHDPVKAAQEMDSYMKNLIFSHRYNDDR